MDFDRCELHYVERRHDVVIPFHMTGTNDSAVAAVTLASTPNLRRRAVQPMEVAIAAPDGEEGRFLSTVNNGAVLLTAVVTKVMSGMAIIPAINTYGGRIKLPSRKGLGVWIPMHEDMELLQMYGELQPQRVQNWLDELGDTSTPLDDELDVAIVTDGQSARELILKLLQAYRDQANAQDECPPPTMSSVTSILENATPIKMRQRRQEHTAEAISDGHVDAILSAGVIEHGEGTWGFPVVLARKKY
ncbi:unnamed protein product [Phytophthora fragariaefolia]|uniref:Unnamed protein product n=1 Tax=Phytophthora fragariaefolia TaxID=1490495 RepID=A0A9W6XZ83_9STRA|nr:unnamed protein product [Phytophthora fragariaefolia]